MYISTNIQSPVCVFCLNQQWKLIRALLMEMRRQTGAPNEAFNLRVVLILCYLSASPKGSRENIRRFDIESVPRNNHTDSGIGVPSGCRWSFGRASVESWLHN